MRRLAIVALGTAVLAGVMAPAGATPAGPGEYPGVRNILPPGQSGSINAVEAAQVAAGDPQGRVAVDGQNAPPNFANQLEMYDALNHADLDGLTDGQLSAFYKDAPLTLSNRDAVRTDRPKSGVVIRWDSFGVPYIEGKTREDAAFGSGYAGTKDRMFLMDLLRHVGAARAAEFLGPDEANVAMDQEQLRAAFYTPEEAAAQIDQAAERFGAEGAAPGRRAGRLHRRASTPRSRRCAPAVVTGPDCPVEYAALQKKPEPWTRADVVYVASLVGGIFGKGGGARVRERPVAAAARGALRRRRGEADLRRPRPRRRPARRPPPRARPAPYGSGPVDPTKPAWRCPTSTVRPHPAPAPTPAAAGSPTRGWARCRAGSAAGPRDRRPGAVRADRPRRRPRHDEQRRAGRRRPHGRRPSAAWSSARRPATSPRSCSPSRRSWRPASGRAGCRSPARASSSSSAAVSTTRGRPPVPAATSSTRSWSDSATRQAGRRPWSPRDTSSAASARRWTSRCTRRRRCPTLPPRACRRRTASSCCAPSTASCRCGRRSTGSRSPSCSSAARTAGSWTPHSGSSGSATPTT